MINKYILLDEISLKIITDDNKETRIFESKEKAVKYGEENYVSWQVIEVPFSDD